MTRMSTFTLCLVDPTGDSVVLLLSGGELAISFSSASKQVEATRQLLERNRLELEDAWERSQQEHRKWLYNRECAHTHEWRVNTQHRAYSCLSHARVTPEHAQEVNRLVDQRQNRSQRVTASYRPPLPRPSRSQCQRRQLCGRTMRAHKRQ